MENLAAKRQAEVDRGRAVRDNIQEHRFALDGTLRLSGGRRVLET